MKKDLLISHVDLDGISPNILMNLTGRCYEYRNIEISEVDKTFDEYFEKGFDEYENIYVCDLTLTKHVYEYLSTHELNIHVFDHHESHLFANEYPFVQVKVDINGIKTCGTELFYLYLKDIYKELNTSIIKDYVELVRELDTYTMIDDRALNLNNIKDTYGNKEFIKLITKRLKKDKKEFEFTAFEKRFLKVKNKELTRYLEKKEKEMKLYEINNNTVAVIFAESNKSELGNYIAKKYLDIDFVILIDASSRISYRAFKDDVSVSKFAEKYNGGGHQKASGSPFTDEDRDKIVKEYFKDIKKLEN